MEGLCKKKFSPVNPHFFQPLLPDFRSNFSIPESFLKYLGKQIKEKKVAKLRNKNVVDKFWMVKVGFDDDKKLHFKEGWKKFCKDHGLEIGDFLVFKYHSNLVFDVFIFDSTTCERPFPGYPLAKPSKKAESSSSIILFNNNNNNNPARNKGFCKKVKGSNRPRNYNKACAKAKLDFTPTRYPYCQTFVKPYCLKWGGMPLPLKFARENDLANKWCDITLIDQKGDEWQLPLRYHKKGTCVYIGKWRHFQIKHSLKPYDPVVFELIALGETPIFNFYK